MFNKSTDTYINLFVEASLTIAKVRNAANNDTSLYCRKHSTIPCVEQTFKAYVSKSKI